MTGGVLNSLVLQSRGGPFSGCVQINFAAKCHFDLLVLLDQTGLIGLKCNRIVFTYKLLNLFDIYSNCERITAPCAGLDFALVTLTTTSAHIHYALAQRI